MKQIRQYTIVCDSTQRELIIGVKRLIEIGWQPYGNPFIKKEGIYQAMVKYEE